MEEDDFEHKNNCMLTNIKVFEEYVKDWWFIFIWGSKNHQSWETVYDTKSGLGKKEEEKTPCKFCCWKT